MAAPELDLLLVDFLSELLYRFDTRGWLTREAQVEVRERDGGWALQGTLVGERLDDRRGTRSSVSDQGGDLPRAPGRPARTARGRRRSCSTFRGTGRVGCVGQRQPGASDPCLASWRRMMKVEQIDEYRWRIPREGTDARRRHRLRRRGDDGATSAGRASLQQVANVAHLPGIVGASLAMPDIHWGYGFPIGGVAATDADEGVVSPGGVGYDINCGVRLVASSLTRADVTPRLREIVKAMYCARADRRRRASPRPATVEAAISTRVATGAHAGRSNAGYGDADGSRAHRRGWRAAGRRARRSCLTARRERGQSQLGTLGSGNHFAELQYVAEIYDEPVAAAFGLARDQVTVMIHSGSRGLGHQVCDDHLRVMIRASPNVRHRRCPIGSCAARRSRRRRDVSTSRR